MSQGLSVVIPTRNEPLTWWTVRNLWRAAAGVALDVIVVDDGSDIDLMELNHRYDALNEKPDNCGLRILTDDTGPIGNCYRRDQGIVEAQYDAVLVLDAHCNMKRGVPTALLRHYDCDPTAISCTISARLSSSEGRTEIDDAIEPAYVGAYIQESQRTSTGEYRVMQGVWTHRQDVRDDLAEGFAADIGCLMGGAYLLSQANYISGLCRPWRHNRGWGTSEPVLAIAQASVGLAIQVIPVVIGHDYRSGKQHLVPYASPPIQHIVANQLLAAAMMCGRDSTEFADALAFIGQGWSVGVQRAALIELEDNGGLEYAAKVNRAMSPVKLQKWMSDYASREPSK